MAAALDYRGYPTSDSENSESGDMLLSCFSDSRPMPQVANGGVGAMAGGLDYNGNSYNARACFAWNTGGSKRSRKNSLDGLEGDSNLFGSNRSQSTSHGNSNGNNSNGGGSWGSSWNPFAQPQQRQSAPFNQTSSANGSSHLGQSFTNGGTNGDSNGDSNGGENKDQEEEDDNGEYVSKISRPPTSNNVKNYTSSLADALKSLSIQEREEAYEELHGVPRTHQESSDSPENIHSKLEEFELYIQTKIRNKDKTAYLTAMQQDPAYVQSTDFRLKFLYAEDFCVEDAAKKYVRHFQSKLTFFGEHLLTKEITFARLDPIERETMSKCASSQVLPYRDTSDRPITFTWERYHRLFYKTDNPPVFMARMFWYFMMALTEDEVAYRKGIVHVAYALDVVIRNEEVDRRVWWNTSIVANSVPVRVGGIHYCFNKSVFSPILSLITMGFPKKIQSRIRVHTGTHQEVQYSLMSYGLPVDCFPITSSYEWKKAYATKWFDFRNKKEQYPERYKDSVYLPSRSDILLGRGKPRQLHPGNQQFHDFVVKFYEEYNTAKRKVKTEIAQKIVDEIKAFESTKVYTKDENDIWILANDDQLRDKVCHSLRRNRRLEKKLCQSSTKKQSQQEQQTTMDVDSPVSTLPDIHISDSFNEDTKTPHEEVILDEDLDDGLLSPMEDYTVVSTSSSSQLVNQHSANKRLKMLTSAV